MSGQGYGDRQVYIQYNPDEMETVTYAGLIATLYGALEYDINIDGLTISRREHDPEDIPEYGISRTNYKKSYVYDGQGNIKEVVYRSVIG